MSVVSTKTDRCPLCGATTSEIPRGRMEAGDLLIEGVEVTRAGRKIHLTPQEFWLLVYLVRNKNLVVTRRMVEEHAWGTDFEAATNQVDVYIHMLRNKLDKDFESKLIHTVRGYGYKLVAHPVAQEVAV